MREAGTPAGSSQSDRARPKFDSGSDAGTARSSPQKNSVRDQSTAVRARRGKNVVPTDPPGRATEKKPRAGRAQRASSSKRAASASARAAGVLTTTFGGMACSLRVVVGARVEAHVGVVRAPKGSQVQRMVVVLEAVRRVGV